MTVPSVARLSAASATPLAQRAAASVVACVRAYVRRRRAVVRMSVLCQCCGQRRVLVCLRHV